MAYGWYFGISGYPGERGVVGVSRSSVSNNVTRRVTREGGMRHGENVGMPAVIIIARCREWPARLAGPAIICCVFLARSFGGRLPGRPQPASEHQGWHRRVIGGALILKRRIGARRHHPQCRRARYGAARVMMIMLAGGSA